jgi:hypothetical protein
VSGGRTGALSRGAFLEIVIYRSVAAILQRALRSRSPN